MTQWLRQSTAGQEVFLGKFVDATDGNTAETGLTIANTDIKLHKEGAISMVNKNSGGAAHMQDGDYYAILDATDSNTLGKLVITVHVAGALYVKSEFMVLPANVYDSMVLGTDTLNAAVTEWNGVSLSTTNPLPNAAAGAAGGLPTDSTGITMFNNISTTEVNTEVAAAIVTYRLDHLAHTAVTGADVTDNSIIAKMVSKAATADWDTYDNTTDAQEAIRDRGDTSWITGGGGSITQVLDVKPVIPNDIDLADTATVRFGLILTNAVDDLPTTAEITPGTISIERKAYGGTSWSAVVTDAAMSEQDGMVYYDEVVDSGSGYDHNDSIRITFKSVSITADANTFEVVGTNGVMFQTSVRQKYPNNFKDTAVAIGTGWLTIGTNQDKTGYEILGTKTTLDDLNDIAATDIVTNGAITTLSGAVVNVDLVDTCTTNTDMLTVAAIADAVWDEAQSGHTTAGTFGKYLDLEVSAAGGGGTPPQLLQSTTIATLASQTNFTLTSGSADDDAYNGAIVVIVDQSTSTQKAFATVSDYVGSTKTVTLGGTPIFTIAVGDTIHVIAPLGAAGSAPTAAAIRAEIDANSTQLAEIVADTNELQTDLVDGGRIDLLIDSILADTNELQADWTNGGRLDLIVDAILAAIDAEIAAIKAKTDQLTFTDTGKVDVTIQAAADIKAAVANKMADHLLRRSLASALASSDGDTKAFRSLAGAVSKQVNKLAIVGSNLLTYEPDDTTTLGTQAVTTSSSSNPITELDTQ